MNTILTKETDVTMYSFGIRKQEIVRKQEMQDNRWRRYNANTETSVIYSQKKRWRGTLRGYRGRHDFNDGVRFNVTIPLPGKIVYRGTSTWGDHLGHRHNNAMHIYFEGAVWHHRWFWGDAGNYYPSQKNNHRAQTRAKATQVATTFGWPNFIREEFNNNGGYPEHIFYFYHHCEYDVHGRKFVMYEATPAYPNPVANNRD